ncbi:MAG TPA: hypothetical protein VGI16_12765 [Candidatus Acidoferrum sp.]
MKQIIGLVLTSLLFVSSLLAQDKGAAALAAAGCGPRDAQFNVKNDGKQHPLPQPEPGKATVVVLSQFGVCIGCKNILRVGIDGAWVGANNGHSYLFSSVETGDHRVCVAYQSSLKRRAETASALTVTAVPGTVYYLLVRPSSDGLKLKAVDSAEGPILTKSAAHSISEPKKPAA